MPQGRNEQPSGGYGGVSGAPGGFQSSRNQQGGYGGNGGASGSPGGFQQGGFQPGGFQQGGLQSGGFQQGGLQSGGFQQGGFQQGGFQQGGFQPGGFQQGGFQQGSALMIRPTSEMRGGMNDGAIMSGEGSAGWFGSSRGEQPVLSPGMRGGRNYYHYDYDLGPRRDGYRFDYRVDRGPRRRRRDDGRFIYRDDRGGSRRRRRYDGRYDDYRFDYSEDRGPRRRRRRDHDSYDDYRYDYRDDRGARRRRRADDRYDRYDDRYDGRRREFRGYDGRVNDILDYREFADFRRASSRRLSKPLRQWFLPAANRFEDNYDDDYEYDGFGSSKNEAESAFSRSAQGRMNSDASWRRAKRWVRGGDDYDRRRDFEDRLGGYRLY